MRLTQELAAARPHLDEAQQRLALCLYRLLARGQSVTPARLAEQAGVPAHDVAELLAPRYGVELDANGSVEAFWGLTLAPTPHRLAIDGPHAARLVRLGHAVPARPDRELDRRRVDVPGQRGGDHPRGNAQRRPAGSAGKRGAIDPTSRRRLQRRHARELLPPRALLRLRGRVRPLGGPRRGDVRHLDRRRL